MYICENCNVEYNKQYGSGRFCCEKCARSYSSSINRTTRNKKLSENMLKRSKDKYSDELIATSIKHHTTMNSAAKSINMPHSSFRRRAKKLGIYAANQGAGKRGRKYTTTDILSNKYENISTGMVKKRLLDDNLKDNRCECCGLLPIWKDSSLVMELHHKDGDSTNNRLENLQILCPNCHSQTATYKNKCRKLISKSPSGGKADTVDSKSTAERHIGSSPMGETNFNGV